MAKHNSIKFGSIRLSKLSNKCENELSFEKNTILDSRDALCNAISEGRHPLRNTSLEAGALPEPCGTLIENDSDRKFSTINYQKAVELDVIGFEYLNINVTFGQI